MNVHILRKRKKLSYVLVIFEDVLVIFKEIIVTFITSK